MYTERESPRTAAKRMQIRTAAQALFLKHGFMRTSTSAIASAARVSKETLYKYYPTKEALLADVLQHSIAGFSAQEFPQMGHAVSNLAEFRQALHVLAEQIVGVLMHPDYLALARVIIAEVPYAPALGLLFRSTVPDRVLGRVAGLLEQALHQRLLHVPDVQAAARLFVGALLTYVFMDGLLVEATAIEPPKAAQIAPIVDLYVRAVQP